MVRGAAWMIWRGGGGIGWRGGGGDSIMNFSLNEEKTPAREKESCMSNTPFISIVHQNFACFRNIESSRKGGQATLIMAKRIWVKYGAENAEKS